MRRQLNKCGNNKMKALANNNKMKNIIAIILMSIVSVMNAQQTASFTYYSFLLAPDTVHAGDTLTLRLTVYNQYRYSSLDSSKCYIRIRVIGGGPNSVYEDIIIPGKFRHPKDKKDTINYKFAMPNFADKYIFNVRASAFLTYFNTSVTPAYNYADATESRIYIPSSPVAVLDYTLDQELGDPLFYIDINGRQLTEPKGMAIAVYSNGRKRKVLFQ